MASPPNVLAKAWSSSFPCRLPECRGDQLVAPAGTLPGLDHAAGNAGAAVAGRVGHLIVFGGVDDERRAVGVEERLRAVEKADAVAIRTQDAEAVLAHLQVGQVAGVWSHR